MPTAIAVLSLLLALPIFGATLQWHWEDSFTPAEQTNLTRWITATVDALEQMIALLPFTVHLHLYRLSDRQEPVPWANTRRGAEQGVDFHVDPQWPLEDFLQDWTAAHELSHLLLPYLGRRHSWFAEGFASYLQYQVLAEIGVISQSEMIDACRARIQRAAAQFSSLGLEQTPFIEAAALLRRQRAYSVYYWGGAAYFMAIDAHLQKEEDTSLNALIREYLSCCRLRGDDFEQLIATLDALLGSSTFSDRLAELKGGRGFPDYQQALLWLQARP